MLRKMLITHDLRNAHKLFFLGANYSKHVLGAECVVYRAYALLLLLILLALLLLLFLVDFSQNF